MPDKIRELPEVTVVLPAALTRLFRDAPDRLAVRASSVSDIIDELERGWPGMRDRLCDSTPRIRRHINVFAGGQRVALDTRLAPGAVVTIMTGVIG